MRSLFNLSALAIVLGILLAGLADPALAKSRVPIRLAEGETPTERVVAAITARALKKAGFRIEIVPIATADALAALEAGALHVHTDLPAGEALTTALAAKSVRSLGGRSDNARDAEAQKVVWAGMKRKWPYAQKLLKRMIIKTEWLTEALAAHADGETADAAADLWWKANPRLWKPWVAASTNWMKP